MVFYLKCWVPSIRSYVEISELTTYQFTILSKYILNEDHIGTNSAFNEIIKENLKNKEIYNNLNRFDKWFILTFLRAVNISSAVYIQTTNLSGAPCNVETDLFNLLTDVSEILIPQLTRLELEGLKFEFKPLSDLYSTNTLCDVVSSIHSSETVIEVDSVEKFAKIFSSSPGIFNYLKNYLVYLDTKLSNHYLIKKEDNRLTLQNVSVKIYDNTLYYFLRSIYLPFCKGLFKKKFKLLKHIGLDHATIDKMTPAECEIYVNQYIAEENDKKSKQNIGSR